MLRGDEQRGDGTAVDLAGGTERELCVEVTRFGPLVRRQAVEAIVEGGSLRGIQVRAGCRRVREDDPLPPPLVGKTDRGVEVKTAPTTLASVLKEDKADGKVPVDPAAVTVEPLMKGVTFSWAKGQGLKFGPKGAELPLGNLRLDVNAAVDTAEGAPVSAGASVSSSTPR